jgi:hypothetical protein
METNVLINKGARGAEALVKGARGAEALVKGARGAEVLAMENNVLTIKGFKGAEAPLVEPFFDGIRKDNARLIFGILLIIIIVDFCMEIIN